MKSIAKAASFASVLLAMPLLATAEERQIDVVTAQYAFKLTPVATGLENPWGLDWLPDGRIIVTERPGRVRLVEQDGTVSEPLSGAPETSSGFRDGLLDVGVSPKFAEDQTVYLAYSKVELEGEVEMRWLEIAAARLGETGFEDLQTIFSSEVKVDQLEGFGARIRFDSQDTMLVTVGDHAVPMEAQNPESKAGTLVRLNLDGTPAAGNPGGALHPAILAYGFKNPQGLAIDSATGAVWLTDHGPRGGGELNLLAVGANYGWPLRTFGDLNGEPGAATTGDFVDPVFTWGVAPTLSLSGLEIYSGEDFPDWTGDLFAGSLSQLALLRVMLNADGSVAGTEYVLDGQIGRIRDVRQGPDGRLYLLNDEFEGGIYRVDP
ncbi:PQQ-dependent sugar dehydrogenase [Algihabitans albus]|uniref:PQQ-dependent sugar dehydrogenase n=1 Tax=Algihabitans albus TaxID=2164067 RepID=UPI000E5D3374|nr:PQQ-dependent sugar dehydrogenase [Algihabitans albus]